MSEEIMVVCKRIRESIDSFIEDPELIEDHDDAEDLLVVLGMADAYVLGAISLTKKAEAHIRSSEKVLTDLLDDSDEEEE